MAAGTVVTEYSNINLPDCIQKCLGQHRRKCKFITYSKDSSPMCTLLKSLSWFPPLYGATTDLVIKTDCIKPMVPKNDLTQITVGQAVKELVKCMNGCVGHREECTGFYYRPEYNDCWTNVSDGSSLLPTPNFVSGYKSCFGHPVPEARNVGAPSISKYFGPSRVLDDRSIRSYVKKIRKTRNQSASPYLGSGINVP